MNVSPPVSLCGTRGGRDQIYEDVTCFDGTDSEWLCGGDAATSQMTDFLFLRIQGLYDYNAFPSTATHSAYNWRAGLECTWLSVVDSKFHSGLVGIADARTPSQGASRSQLASPR